MSTEHKQDIFRHHVTTLIREHLFIGPRTRFMCPICKAVPTSEDRCVPCATQALLELGCTKEWAYSLIAHLGETRNDIKELSDSIDR